VKASSSLENRMGIFFISICIWYFFEMILDHCQLLARFLH